MTMQPGQRLGPYEIVSPVGAGGMGEVYRAKDTRLGRVVAIKVLPEHMSSNPDLRQRFEREARTVSSLSHPHICALYDVGHQDGIDFLVMEYLEGETLAQRLGKGPLPPQQVIRHAIEIAEALEKAHRQGIVHRDLKPGNIMLTQSGTKLLDFGLAKFRESPGGPLAGLSALPTAQQNLTAQGTILGTFQYMAPEQLEGTDADARTDIFAFGAVLYEMATGRKAFEGKTKTSLIAAIVSQDPPPMASLQPMTPPALERVVKTCLAKDPDERWQTAHDVLLELRWIEEAGSQAGVAAPVVARRKHRERAAWIVAITGLVLAAALGVLLYRKISEPVSSVQASILPPPGTEFAFDSGPMALSKDGSRMAFVARDSAGKTSLYLRPLKAGSAQSLNGTDGASYPFWSPDNRFLGFFAGGKLKKIDASGGPPQTLCNAPSGRGGTWNRRGQILFAPSTRSGIHLVSSAGGTPTPVTELDKGNRSFSHRWPEFLPDGRHFLFLNLIVQGVTLSERNETLIASVDRKEPPRVILRANSNVSYVPPGYLLFYRDGSLMAQGFDAGRRKLLGEPFPVRESIQFFSNLSSAAFSASRNGVLTYQTGSAGQRSQLTWFDRSGKDLGSIWTPGSYQRVQISPDGRRVAADLIDAASGNTDIWIYDLARQTATRFTFDPAVDVAPVWSPDGRQIVFSSSRTGIGDLYIKASSGEGSEQLMFGSTSFKGPYSWSQDGRFISVVVNDVTGLDVHVFSIAEKKMRPLIQTPFIDAAGAFSPDGRWIVYHSDESGRVEIYVQPFPGPGGRFQISNAGGTTPFWSHDGREIFFIGADEKLMAVEVTTSPVFEAGQPVALFPTRIPGGTGRRYDVTRDGRRFLVNTRVDDLTTDPVTLVLDWTSSLASAQP